MKMSLTLLVLFFNFNIFASNIDITCETPRKNIIVKLKNNNLRIGGRFPAEAVAQRTRVSGNSLSKIFYVSGDKHTLHLKDTSSFNELNDYISIRNKEGHEITYPITCKNS